MTEKRSIYRRVFAILTAVVAGLLIFSAVSAILLDNTLFSVEYNRNLFNKYDIYGQTEKAVGKSLQSYLETLKASPAGNGEQQEQLLALVDKAVSPAMIKVNLDLFLDGIIKYFKGKTHFLPDIYLYPVQDKSTAELQTKTEQDDTISEKSLGRIDRINFSVFLMYLDRNDITDDLSSIRFIQFILSWLPLFALAFSILALLLFISVSGRAFGYLRWLRTTSLAIGLCGLLTGLGAVYASKFLIPQYAADLRFFIPLQEDVISGYLRNLTEPPAISMSLIGMVMILFRFVLGLKQTGKLADLLKKSFMIKSVPGDRVKRNWMYGTDHMRLVICIVLSIVLAGFLAVKSEAAVGDFRDKDLNVALDRFKGNGIYTRVIAAKDEIIYTLQVKIVDKATLEPVKGVDFTITGMIEGKKAEFNVKGVSDISGPAEFTAGKGTYRLVFNQDSLPGGYVPPPPYVFNINTAGTTIITVNLEQAAQARAGVAEIQILDSNNLPLDKVELTLDPQQSPEDIPGRSFSFSNSEGLAVFRVPEGSYTVSFMSSGFPAGYRLPDPFGISVTSGSTVRYTIRLVPDDSKLQNITTH